MTRHKFFDPELEYAAEQARAIRAGMTIAGYGWEQAPKNQIGGRNTSLRERFLAPNVGSAFGGQVIAETFSRAESTVIATGALLATTGTCVAAAVALTEGQTVGHLGWVSGATAATAPTNQYLLLLDQNRQPLAATADQLTTAIAASTGYAWPIATVNTVPLAPSTGVSVAATTFVAPYTGLYYVVLNVACTTTAPTQTGITTTAAMGALVPILQGLSNTAVTSTIPPYGTAMTALTAGVFRPYYVVTD